MKNPFIIFVIGAIVVLGAGFMFFTSSQRSEPPPIAEGGYIGPVGTLASLMTSGQDLECTFLHDDGSTISTGTVYLTAGASRMRGDFTIKQSTGTMEAHLIRDGGYNYLWGPLFPQGIKTKVTAENEGKLFDDKSGAVDENTEFDCQPWSVDSSKFSPPSGVEFTDMSAQMDVAI